MSSISSLVGKDLETISGSFKTYIQESWIHRLFSFALSLVMPSAITSLYPQDSWWEEWRCRIRGRHLCQVVSRPTDGFDQEKFACRVDCIQVLDM